MLTLFAVRHFQIGKLYFCKPHVYRSHASKSEKGTDGGNRKVTRYFNSITSHIARFEGLCVAASESGQNSVLTSSPADLSVSQDVGKQSFAHFLEYSYLILQVKPISNMVYWLQCLAIFLILDVQENIYTQVLKTRYISAGETGRHVLGFLYLLYIFSWRSNIKDKLMCTGFIHGI